MDEKRRKVFPSHILALVFCVAMLAETYYFSWFHRENDSGQSIPIPFIINLILFVIALFLLFSPFVFPFRYSIFGPYERTPFPDEPALLVQRFSWGRIAMFHGTIPFFSYTLFPSGLGISILGVGRVFIRKEEIIELKKGFFHSYEMRHTSDELRNPVIIPGKRLFEALETLKADRLQN